MTGAAGQLFGLVITFLGVLWVARFAYRYITAPDPRRTPPAPAPATAWPAAPVGMTAAPEPVPGPSEPDQRRADATADPTLGSASVVIGGPQAFSLSENYVAPGRAAEVARRSAVLALGGSLCSLVLEMAFMPPAYVSEPGGVPSAVAGSLGYALILYALARGVVRGVRTWAAIAMLALLIVALISSVMGAIDRFSMISIVMIDAIMILPAAISLKATKAYRRLAGPKGKPTDALSNGHAGLWNFVGIALVLLLVLFGALATRQFSDPAASQVADPLASPTPSAARPSQPAAPPAPVAAEAQPVAPNEVPVFIGTLNADGGDGLGGLLLDRMDQDVGLKIAADAEIYTQRGSAHSRLHSP